jgi:hypothetical protein
VERLSRSKWNELFLFVDPLLTSEQSERSPSKTSRASGGPLPRVGGDSEPASEVANEVGVERSVTSRSEVGANGERASLI